MSDVGVRPYQRRRKGPIAVVVSVLAVLAIATWTTVLTTSTTGSGPGACPTPKNGAPVGEVLPSDALDATAPVPASSVAMRVFNAGGQRGQGLLVAAQLKEWGFTEAAPPNNDPRFPDGDMDCVGQLRFGASGEAAASTLSLVLPCVELVRDGRPDASVDVSVGTAFGDLNPRRFAAGLAVLEQLADPAQGGTGATNADPDAQGAQPAGPAAADPGLLQKARDAHC
ncbi:envelope integrity protein Cei [Pseudonocardia sp. CA-107938]|uniref:envelope integrity protein Cei n=1 Tax=Pseudonocardia sp. CA-107938 TaxID=3240021 RepID=UPI003D8DC15A